MRKFTKSELIILRVMISSGDRAINVNKFVNRYYKNNDISRNYLKKYFYSLIREGLLIGIGTPLAKVKKNFTTEELSEKYGLEILEIKDSAKIK